MPSYPRSDSVEYKQSAPWTLAIENDANGNPVYIGRAVPANCLLYAGASPAVDPKSKPIWQIQKNTFQALTVGGVTGYYVTDIQWAGGTDTFSNVWNNRASVTYA